MYKRLSVPSRLRRFLTLAVLIASVTGCGGSSFEDTISSGPNGGNAGSVTFELARVQSAFRVPQATTALRFEFYTEPNAEGFFSQAPQLREFVPQLTLSPVTISTRSILMAALDADGETLEAAVANVTVMAGQDTTATLIALENADPVLILGSVDLTFSQGAEELVPFADILITDDQQTLNGGELELITRGDESTLQLGDISPIGRLLEDDGLRAVIALDQNATPQSVAEFVKALKVVGTEGGSLTRGFVEVRLSDGRAGDNDEEPTTVAYRATVTKSITVRVPEDFPRIVQAINHIVNQGGPFSTIQLGPQDYLSEGVIFINDHPNLYYLSIEGTLRIDSENPVSIPAQATRIGAVAVVKATGFKLRNLVVSPRSNIVPGVAIEGAATNFGAERVIFDGTGSGQQTSGMLTKFAQQSSVHPNQPSAYDCVFFNWGSAINVAGAPGSNALRLPRFENSKFIQNKTGIAMSHILQTGADTSLGVYENEFVDNDIHLKVIGNDGQRHVARKNKFVGKGTVVVASENPPAGLVPSVTLELVESQWFGADKSIRLPGPRPDQLIDNKPNQVIITR